MILDIEKILKLTQEELLDFCYIELIKRNYSNKKIIFTDDYLYAKGNIPVLLVAHCDIVHKEIPKTIVYDKKQKILWSPTGIGGDDRCGVYSILKICEKFKPYVLFTTDEEIGGMGVRKFVKEIDEIPVNFIIEIDRRGNNQVVFYRCENKEFQNYILSFGFDKQFGSYSDVSTLSVEYDIAGCNVSAGYYNEHTTTEHIYLDHLQNTIEKIEEILKDKQNHKFYDCQKIEYKTQWNYDDKYYYDDYWGCYRLKNLKKSKEIEELEELTFDEMVQREDDYYALNDEQWKKKYGKDKPKDVLDVYN